jgi:hypothetical protein
MIFKNTLTKLKSLFFSPKVPNPPVFILSPRLEDCNKDFHSLHIPRILSSLEFCRSLSYFVAEYQVSLITRLSNICIRDKGIIPITDLEAEIKSRYSTLGIAISNLLQLNKLYLEFSKEEKRNIELNTLLDEFPPSVYKCILFHRADEYEALVPILPNIVNYYNKTSNIDRNLITQIKDVINNQCSDDPLLKELKNVMEYIAIPDYRLTSKDLVSLHPIELWIGHHQQSFEIVVKGLVRDRATFTNLHTYLEMKLEMMNKKNDSF